MREFADLGREGGLRKFLASPLGTLYMMLDVRGFPTVMVRHFDRELAPALGSVLADLVRATARWITEHPALASLITVEPPLEVGRDFVSRRFHVIGAAISAYDESDDPPEPPEELQRLRDTFRDAMGAMVDSKDRVIGRVLARSLLEPTGKTYFDEMQRRFIVVEPTLLRADVEEWATLGNCPLAAGPASR